MDRRWRRPNTPGNHAVRLGETFRRLFHPVFPKILDPRTHTGQKGLHQGALGLSGVIQVMGGPIMDHLAERDRSELAVASAAGKVLLRSYLMIIVRIIAANSTRFLRKTVVVEARNDVHAAKNFYGCS